jgi:hypothetical protein
MAWWDDALLGEEQCASRMAGVLSDLAGLGPDNEEDRRVRDLVTMLPIH